MLIRITHEFIDYSAYMCIIWYGTYHTIHKAPKCWDIQSSLHRSCSSLVFDYRSLNNFKWLANEVLNSFISFMLNLYKPFSTYSTWDNLSVSTLLSLLILIPKILSISLKFFISNSCESYFIMPDPTINIFSMYRRRIMYYTSYFLI